MFSVEPNYNKLRTFGSLCFPWLRPYAPNKLQNRSAPCVFLGYSLTQSAYICLESTSSRIYISTHVQFDETQFPFSTLTTTSSTINSEQQRPHPTSPPLDTLLVRSPQLPTEPTLETTSPQAASPETSPAQHHDEQRSVLLPEQTHPTQPTPTIEPTPTNPTTTSLTSQPQQPLPTRQTPPI